MCQHSRLFALVNFVSQLVLRENDLIALPKEMGELTRLRELHVQGNRLTALPPELGRYLTALLFVTRLAQSAL